MVLYQNEGEKMDPNQFREARVRINELCNNIAVLADKKDIETSKETYEKATQLLESLTPQAEGEIQERSVKNLGLKIKVADMLIGKIKPLRKKKPRKTVPKVYIDWTMERLESLSSNYLAKVFANMGTNADTKVYFSATGKGVRPSYQVEASDQDDIAFSGSGHKPLKRKLPSGEKDLSPPFSRSVIESILERK